MASLRRLCASFRGSDRECWGDRGGYLPLAVSWNTSSGGLTRPACPLGPKPSASQRPPTIRGAAATERPTCLSDRGCPTLPLTEPSPAALARIKVCLPSGREGLRGAKEIGPSVV